MADIFIRALNAGWCPKQIGRRWPYFRPIHSYNWFLTVGNFKQCGWCGWDAQHKTVTGNPWGPALAEKGKETTHAARGTGD